jgi:superoxide dismutase, Fe-Mn family
MKHVTPYQAKSFDLHGLTGISDRTLDMHFKLYAGYVKETNTLTDRIRDVLKDGKVDQDEMPAYSELKRRLGFEYNGMVLHEYYFENMKKGGAGDPGRTSPFIQAAEESFGSYEIWKTDFCRGRQNAGRGLGYVLPQPREWTTVEPLGDAARDRECGRLRAAARHGCLGTRLYPGLQTFGTSGVYRCVFLEYQLSGR